MARAILDDPDARQVVIDVLSAGGTLDDAGQRVGCSRRAISKYAARNPEFGDRVAAAQHRREVLREELPRAAIRATKRKRTPEKQATDAQALATVTGVPVEIVEDGDRDPGGPTAAELVDLCWVIAQSPEHRGCAQALRILAEYKLGPLVRAQQRREEREAAAATVSDDRPQTVLVKLPTNGTEAPGHEPVIDVEVVE